MGLQKFCGLRVITVVLCQNSVRGSSKWIPCTSCSFIRCSTCSSTSPLLGRKTLDACSPRFCTFSRLGETMASSGQDLTLQNCSDGMEAKEDDKSNDQQADEVPPLQKALGSSSPSQTPKEQANLSKRAKKKLLRFQKIKAMKKNKTKNQSDRAAEVGFGDEIYNETEYYFENGLRKVYPYYYTFSTYVKRRWIGQTVLDVFSKEFCADDEADYRQIIETGRLTVNGEKVSPDHVLKDSELLCHRVHRHENPVVGCAVEVIADTEDVLVVNKPASIPCHPCGRYRHNSMVFILGKELGRYNLRNIYRLDRLTSGVLVLGKTDARSKELEQQVAQRQVQKTYLARVTGCFPEGEVEVKQPLDCASPKLGLWRVSPHGKPSHTSFRRLAFNGHSSLVQCVPHTGRTHQIRVHLQFLGHPIVNDPFYNSEAWGPGRGKGGEYGAPLSEVVARLMEKHNPRLWEEGENPLYHARLAQLAAEAERGGSSEAAESGGNGVAAVAVLEAEELGGRAAHPAPTGTPLAEAAAAPSSSASVEQDPRVPMSHAAELVCPDLETPQSPALEQADNLPPSVGSSPPADDGEPPRKQRRVEGRSVFPPFQPDKWIPDVECDRCRIKYRDPKPSELILYLHALTYEGPGWKYEAPPPAWASQDWTEDGEDAVGVDPTP